MRSPSVLGARGALIALAILLMAAACGGGAAEPESAGDTEPATGGTEGSAEAAGAITALLPIDSPNVYGFKLAESLGYFEDQGVEATLEYVDGSGEAIRQLLAGNGDIAVVGTGTVLDALVEGRDDVRVIGNVNYGSVFFLTVPAESDITSAEQLAGVRVGVSELSGGEIPVVQGIIRSAGLEPGQDVELVPIGTGTALAARAIEEGQVDAFGGSVNDVIALEVQGLELRRILPEILTTLPGLPVATTQGVLDEQQDAVVAFMRAMTMGQEFGQANPDAALAVLEDADPEQFTDETGGLIFEAVLPLWRAPEGQLFGSQTVEQWEDFAAFVQAELPEGADLSTVIVPEIPEAANDYDHDALREEAETYADG